MTEKEYNECVRTYADNVYRFIVKNLRHEEDAQDVVQTAFEKMWRNRQEVQYATSKSYLFTVAYHQMIDPYLFIVLRAPVRKVTGCRVFFLL